MPQPNVQFSVASHIMASLAVRPGEPTRSSDLASSVNADPSFVRRVISKLAKAGLVTTTRGKTGSCMLARPATEITLLDIYNASDAPKAYVVHGYAVAEGCHVSRNIKGCLEGVLCSAQTSFEQGLAQHTLSQIVTAIEDGP
ncbi:Rrf2 family transcriptional regulator [Pseudomonas sp. SLFW]|uniref:Rrf2 family transcriptional regulator n=1 Tax=Pseudomonas TaxID=286 RepID=UPI00141239F4|nr:Rrf2 family transcriptional regulator [Pseudomonas sp. SLFW]NBB10159.1 BadM/Rrf2 family transcriptional regulator [Pseudomonas sp. SLFW]